MSRLPTPGADDGTWGGILNDFLSQSLSPTDGSLKPASVAAAGAELTSNKNTPNGYPGLNGSGLVATSKLGTGSATTSTYLRGDGSWQAPPGGGGSSTLAGDSDVSITSPSSNQVLTWNGTTWVNQAPLVSSVAGRAGNVTLTAADITGVEKTANKDQANGYPGLNGSGLVTTSKLGTGTASSSTYLRGDGSWQAPPSGSSTLAGDSDVSISSPGSNQVLTWNGTTWVNQAPLVSSVAGRGGAVTLTAADISGVEKTANKDVAGGYAGLDSNTLLKVTEMPRALGVVVDLGTNNTGTVSCDLSQGIAFKVVLTTNTTISFTNWPSSGLVEPEVYSIQDSTGGHSITMSGVTWEPTGSPPTFNTGANAVNIIPVASFDGGATIYGITGQQGPAGSNGSPGPGICTFSMAGVVVTTGSTGSRQYFESSYTVGTVRASVGTAPVGSSLTVDIIKNNGSSILSSPLSITTGTFTATTTSFASSSLSAGDYLTVTVTAVGSSTPGADLTVTVTVH